MAKTQMGMPAELSDDAEKMLALHGYFWDSLLYGFRRARRIGQESLDQYLKAAPNVISFEELTDHGLFEPHATPAKIAASLKWLEQRVKSN
jgi:hypothetical protein